MCAALLMCVSEKEGQMWHLHRKGRRGKEEGWEEKWRKDKRQRDRARRRMTEGAGEHGRK